MTERGNPTPGPWRARLVHNQMDDPGTTLARVGPRLPDGRQWMVFSDADRGDPEADARLMAVAPRLLDVLEAVQWGWGWAPCPCCDLFEEDGHGPNCRLAAALAAARGDQA